MERRPLVQEPLRGGHIHAAPVPRWVYRPPSDSGGLSRHLIYSLPDIIVNFGTYLGYHYATRVVKNIITSSPSEPGEPPPYNGGPPGADRVVYEYVVCVSRRDKGSIQAFIPPLSVISVPSVVVPPTQEFRKSGLC